MRVATLLVATIVSAMVAPSLVVKLLSALFPSAAMMLLPALRPPPGIAVLPMARISAPQVAEREWWQEKIHWYQLRLNDQPCGWMSATEYSATEGTVRRSVNSSAVRFGRSGSEVEVAVKVVFDETKNGEPLRCEVTQRSGKDPIEQVYRFDSAAGTKAQVTSKQGGRTVESTIELPMQRWLTPLAAEAFAAARRRAGARDYTLLTVDPASGMKAVEIRAERGDSSKFTIDGREISTVRWTVHNSLLQVPSIEEWSDDDVMMRSVSTLPIGRLEAVLSDRATAMGSTKGPPVELMVKTVVHPDKPIEAIDRVGRARFRVSTVKGELQDFPSIGAQRVTRNSPTAIEITVDESASTPATDAEKADERFRRASVAVDSDDPLIRELATRALENFPKAATRNQAEALRRAVNRHIRKKVMSSAFASASETARSREGDCTEHAMLFAAMLRAQGIPSRVMTGLIYCPEFAGQKSVFGWHMWTQALVDGAWVDLDATLPDATPFHGGHIATGWSAQEQGALDAEWAALVTLIGNLRIEVLETARREIPIAR